MAQDRLPSDAENEDDPMEDSHPIERQCTAHSRSGNQCKRVAILGGKVCYMHGGNAPQVQNAARLRLLEMAEPALFKLLQLVKRDDDKTINTQYAAAKDILDRIGLAAVTRVEVDSAPDADEFSAYLQGRADAFEQEKAKG